MNLRFVRVIDNLCMCKRVQAHPTHSLIPFTHPAHTHTHANTTCMLRHMQNILMIIHAPSESTC